MEYNFDYVQLMSAYQYVIPIQPILYVYSLEYNITYI